MSTKQIIDEIDKLSENEKEEIIPIFKSKLVYLK
jgi:hypothetical protein